MNQGYMTALSTPIPTQGGSRDALRKIFELFWDIFLRELAETRCLKSILWAVAAAAVVAVVVAAAAAAVVVAAVAVVVAAAVAVGRRPFGRLADAAWREQVVAAVGTLQRRQR